MRKVTIIYGPPGAGKTSYALKQMRRGDIIVDLDRIFMALSGRDMHDKPANLLGMVLAIRESIFAEIERNIAELNHVWITMGGAKRHERYKLVKRFNAETILIKATLNECYARIRDDKTRRGHWKLSKPFIDRWFSEYEPD